MSAVLRQLLIVAAGILLAVTLVAIAFSLVASAVYLLNDLVDLDSDRDHATKRFRPLASGRMPIVHAAALTPLLLLVGFGLALAIEFLDKTPSDTQHHRK